MSWHTAARAREDMARNPQVKCIQCGYHYRARTGHVKPTGHGWVCEDNTRCRRNLARQAHYRETT